MAILRIGYVREHFSAPLLQYAEADQAKTFTLVECPGGTGQLIARLTDDTIDVAIALTDALIAGIANGSQSYKLVGSYVTTPLNWAVITGKDSVYQQIADLKGTTMGISRPGSGSQTMAHVMALQQGWSKDDLRFQVNDDIHGLIASVNDASTSAFMWEWFTTKPFLDKGDVRFIGSVPTPWPSWLIAAHPSPSRAPPTAVRTFLADLTRFVRSFDAPSSRVSTGLEFISEKFGYPREDVKAWLETVGYPEDCAVIPKQVIVNTLNMLETAGVVSSPASGFNVDDFVDATITELVV